MLCFLSLRVAEGLVAASAMAFRSRSIAALHWACPHGQVNLSPRNPAWISDPSHVLITVQVIAGPSAGWAKALQISTLQALRSSFSLAIRAVSSGLTAVSSAIAGPVNEKRPAIHATLAA